jgi:hypothetical protein
MKRKMATLAGTAALVAAVSAGPAAAAPGGGKNCVGSAVSQAAHLTQQVFDQGFGAYFHALGTTPGQAIQAYDAAACDA